MEQVNKMAFALAELQLSLDVYKGLFQEKENHEVLFSQFQEIGSVLKKSLIVTILIESAALFTDNDRTCGNENMSFQNLHIKHSNNFSDETVSLMHKINAIVNEMNLKTFRNKHVGHFGLDEKLGKKQVVRNITIHNLEELFKTGQILLNMIIRDAKLLPVGHCLGYYTPIPDSRSIKNFLDRLRPLSRHT